MLTNLILKPIITEKSLIQAQVGKVTFLVNKLATKTQLKKELKNLFNVDPLKVYFQTKPGKTRRFGKKRLPSKTKSYKKAIITLKSGQTIEYFNLPEEKSATRKKSSAPSASRGSDSSALSKNKSRKGLFGRLKKTTVRKQPD